MRQQADTPPPSPNNLLLPPPSSVPTAVVAMRTLEPFSLVAMVISYLDPYRGEHHMDGAGEVTLTPGHSGRRYSAAVTVVAQRSAVRYAHVHSGHVSGIAVPRCRRRIRALFNLTNAQTSVARPWLHPHGAGTGINPEYGRLHIYPLMNRSDESPNRLIHLHNHTLFILILTVFILVMSRPCTPCLLLP